MKKVYKANLYFLIILLLESLGSRFIAKIIKALKITDVRLVLFMTHFCVFIIPAIVYVIISKKSPKEIFKINKLYVRDILLITLLSFACQPIVAFCSLISQLFFNNNVGEVITGIINTPYIILLLLVAVMPAITEEITMRGIILSGYEDKNVYISSIIIGLFFGMMHLDGQQFLYAAVLGFILALIVRITNSIFASMLMHFLINGMQVTLQKLISFIGHGNMVMDEAANISFKDLPSITKITAISFYGILACGFAVAVFFIIKRLKDLNIRRGIITEEEMSFNGKRFRVNDGESIIEQEEKIINLPLIVSLIVYFVIMYFS